MLASIWVIITSYMNTSTRVYSYFWSMAGITCLVILTAGAGNDQNLFESAMFRTLETALGISVYMLVSVFLWPRTNIGAIQKTSLALLSKQQNLFTAISSSNIASEEDLNKLRAQELQLISKLDQDLQAEGSESYEVNKNAKNCFVPIPKSKRWIFKVNYKSTRKPWTALR